MKLTLKQWRGAREISQREMSERLGVSSNGYLKWEKEPQNIKIGYAIRIAEILGVSIDEIDFSKGKMA